MSTYTLNFDEVRYRRPLDALFELKISPAPTDELDFGEPIGKVRVIDLIKAISTHVDMTQGSCQPQLAAHLFAITRKARLMNHYFPITNAFNPHEQAEFYRLIASIAYYPTFDIRLFDVNRKDYGDHLPPDAGYLVAGHIAEIFFYRPDLLDKFFSETRGFYLYTTPQAFKDDGGVAGGCYNPQRNAIQLVMSRLYEGFYAPTPGVAPFIHEFGHMLDHASGNRGLIPGMDGVIELFRRGKRLELQRYQQLHIGRGDELPIGHPYVFQNNGEFIAGYLEMFFRNPHYFAAQNADLFQAFAQCLLQDPRQYWKEDFPYYVQQNRDYYLKSGQRPPKPGITIP